MKKSDIKDAVNFIFREKSIEDKERTIKGFRGCVTTGHKSIDDFSHCEDDRCAGCNMYEKAFRDELNKQLQDYESKTAERILSETPQHIKDEVREYANKIVDMKNKIVEELAKDYANEKFEMCSYGYTNDGRLTDFDKIKKAWLKGYKTATPKWVSVEDYLPEDDREVLCYIENKENPNWSENRLGSYIDENWYCKGGRESHEIVTKWQEIVK